VGVRIVSVFACVVDTGDPGSLALGDPLGEVPNKVAALLLVEFERESNADLVTDPFVFPPA
jgi:hypothetical protein